MSGLFAGITISSCEGRNGGIHGQLLMGKCGLLGGRHKEGRSRGTGHNPTSLEHQKEEGWITVDVVLNIEIQKHSVAP